MVEIVEETIKNGICFKFSFFKHWINLWSVFKGITVSKSGAQRSKMFSIDFFR